ncbi:MAG: phage antirepressor protein [Ruminococcaceae bacterium]|nr:phage antirepressor protein [Oscillospiraceae bacterium]
MSENSNNQAMKLFENKNIRTAWDGVQEEWYFSIVDVCDVLSGTDNPRRYWSDLKRKLKAEDAVEVYEKIVQLKMTAPDGKQRLTDVADTEQLLRIIQSIPSPKAEPFKMWLAQVGTERIEETIDPEQAIDRALETYMKKGYTREWINQRLQAIQVRKELTDEWQDCGVKKGIEYAILTDEITRAWSGMSTKQYKRLKGLKKENLCDNMSTTEIVLNMLAETSTTDISKAEQPQTFSDNQKVARRGGSVAGIARKALEAETGKPVVTPKNAADFHALLTDIIKDAAMLSENTSKAEDEKED